VKKRETEFIIRENGNGQLQKLENRKCEEITITVMMIIIIIIIIVTIIQVRIEKRTIHTKHSLH